MRLSSGTRPAKALRYCPHRAIRPARCEPSPRQRRVCGSSAWFSVRLDHAALPPSLARSWALDGLPMMAAWEPERREHRILADMLGLMAGVMVPVPAFRTVTQRQPFWRQSANANHSCAISSLRVDIPGPSCAKRSRGTVTGRSTPLSGAVPPSDLSAPSRDHPAHVRMASKMPLPCKDVGKPIAPDEASVMIDHMRITTRPRARYRHV